MIGVGQVPAGAVTPPVAVDDAYTTRFGEALTLVAPGVLANDTDDVGPLTAGGASTPAHGTVSLNANGSFTYTPQANFVGNDTFTYTVSDGVDGTDTGLVTITVSPNTAEMFKDINPGTGGSNPGSYTQVGGTTVFFSTNPATQGLWATDGTPAGIVQLKSLNLSILAGIGFQPPLPVGGMVVFQASDGISGSELWVSDGTAAGTVLLKDINPGIADAFPNNLTVVGSTVYFQAQEATNGAELWKTDGTAAGTVLVKDIAPGAAFSSPACGGAGVNCSGGMFVQGSSIFFAANDGSTGVELWTSDGTAAGTVLVKDIRSGSGNGSPQKLTAFAGTVLFSAGDATSGTELWQTDGTTAGTVLFKDISPGSANSTPSCGVSTCAGYLVVGSTAYFSATTAATGAELWKTDGTAAGTVMVKDIRPGTTGGTTATNFSSVLGTVLFNANDGTTGIEHWQTDGTTAGTVLFKDLNPGTGSATPGTPVQFGSVAYFGASNGTNGALELFKTDGTAAGTVLVKDINPGSATSGVSGFTPLFGTLFFSANNGVNGAEPWRLSPANTAPVAVDDAYSTGEDTPLTVSAPGVLANDTDANANVLHDASKLSDPANGAVTFNGDGSFTYTPNAGFSGGDSFTYKVTDGMDDSNVATVNLTVAAVNDAPVAVDDTGSTSEDTPLVVAGPGVLGNDTDAESDPLTAGSASTPVNGAVVLNADGSYTYTPNADYNGPDSFTYVASDGNGGTDTATVSITVSAVADAPVAGDDTYGTNEDTPLTEAAPGVLTNDTDADGDSLSAGSASIPANGSVTLNGDGSFTYTPDAGFHGTDTFTYVLSDGNAGTDTATVTIAVSAVNDAPTSGDDTASTSEDTPLTVTAPGVLGNDTDPDADALTAGSASTPANGSVVLNADGSYTYTPNADFNGSDSFTYLADDGNGGTDAATVAITVSAVNDAPVAGDDTTGTAFNTPVTVVAPGVLGNDTDVDGDTLTAGSATTPANGAVTLNADGSYTYTPSTGFSGSDTFTYVASDGNGGTDSATVTVTVAPSPGPDISVGSVAVHEGDTLNRKAVFTVSLAAPSASPVAVNYATADGTATAGSDYTATSGTATFAPGATAATVKVKVAGDTVVEADEGFSVVLSGASGGSIANGTGTGTIVNDDAGTGKRLAIGDVSVHEGNNGARSAVFTVSLSKAAATTVTVNYATANGTATKLVDYTKTTGTLSFAAGITSMTVAVPILADAAVEGDETLTVILSGVYGAVISDASGLGTIVDDD